MFVPLYFGLVVLGNGVEPFFSARKADVLSDRRTEQTARFFTGFWLKSFNFAAVMEIYLLLLVLLVREIRVLVKEIKRR